MFYGELMRSMCPQSLLFGCVHFRPQLIKSSTHCRRSLSDVRRSPFFLLLESLTQPVLQHLNIPPLIRSLFTCSSLAESNCLIVHLLLKDAYSISRVAEVAKYEHSLLKQKYRHLCKSRSTGSTSLVIIIIIMQRLLHLKISRICPSCSESHQKIS